MEHPTSRNVLWWTAWKPKQENKKKWSKEQFRIVPFRTHMGLKSKHVDSLIATSLQSEKSLRKQVHQCHDKAYHHPRCTKQPFFRFSILWACSSMLFAFHLPDLLDLTIKTCWRVSSYNLPLLLGIFLLWKHCWQIWLERKYACSIPSYWSDDPRRLFMCNGPRSGSCRWRAWFWSLWYIYLIVLDHCYCLFVGNDGQPLPRFAVTERHTQFR